MKLKSLIVGCLVCTNAFAQEATPAQREEEVRARIQGRRLERATALPTPMKRTESPPATLPVRVTPEQYKALAAEYKGSVKLLRLERSERAFNGALLAELVEAAAAAMRTNETATVKYYTSVSHSSDRLMTYGHSFGRDASVPPASGFYSEFFADRTGRLHTIVDHDVDGTRYVTDVILYSEGRPYANVSYNRAGEVEFADVLYFRSDQPYLSGRILRDGSAWMDLARTPTGERSRGIDETPAQPPPMKRAEGPRAGLPARVTAEEYKALAAEYKGSVKLLRLDESERAFNAALLAELVEAAAAGLRTNEAATVKYYGGISHSPDRVMVYGHSYGKDASVPPTNGYYSEFFADRAGRLQTIVGHDVDGTRYVTDALLYAEGRPYARLSYNRAGEAQYADLVYHRGEQPYLSGRILRDGSAWMELMNTPAGGVESK